MPELPEVETIRRDLQYAILGKGIRKVELLTGRCVKNDPDEFIRVLKDNRLESIDRRGKLLLFELAFGDKTLAVHLRMTGQLLCEIPGGLLVGGHPSSSIESIPNKHTHIAISFADKSKLYFNDVRTFGYLQLITDQEKEKVLKKFGAEPLGKDFSVKYFFGLMNNSKTNIKTLLLNQSLIAGIGNIYADEICHRAKVRPDRKVPTLTKSEITRIYNACKNILARAVEKRGTTFSDYVDAAGKKGGYYQELKVYHREGERCYRCGDDFIKKIKLGGRGTHYCESCQK